ncbi:MAG: hypothetical protein K8S97_02855 [Anaerolineae bacterium]|nr:hypothetical protein [Anaerolineae bacterium]
MPLLTFDDADGVMQRLSFPEQADIHIGADEEWSDVPLTAALGAAPRHAVIARSALNRLLLLVDLTGSQTWVNQHRVVNVRVLRQGDVVRVGHGEFRVWEVQIRHLEDGDPAVGQKCPVSRRTLEVGDAVIACPGCGTVHERDAWFLITTCAADCGYPNRDVIIDTLPDGVQMERALDSDSRLVERIEQGRMIQEGEYCQAGQARDQVPFQEGQNVVYCPSCQTPYHLECFVTLDECPVCQHEIRALIDQAFMAEPERS